MSIQSSVNSMIGSASTAIGLTKTLVKSSKLKKSNPPTGSSKVDQNVKQAEDKLDTRIQEIALGLPMIGSRGEDN